MLPLFRSLLDRLLRALVRVAVGLTYRPRVRGQAHLPAAGALLVANHASYADALVLAAATPRPVRFLMHRQLFRRPLLRAVAWCTGTLPIASSDPPEEKAAALERAARCVAAGELVCIFAEGALTRTGELGPFRHGLETIARRASAPIVPVALAGLWGSWFSFARGRPFRGWPARGPRPVEVTFGAPLAAGTPAQAVRSHVARLLAGSARRGRVDHPGLPAVPNAPSVSHAPASGAAAGSREGPG